MIYHIVKKGIYIVLADRGVKSPVGYAREGEYTKRQGGVL